MKRILLLISSLFSFTAQAEIINISLDEMSAMSGKNIPLIDIRTLGEWNQTGVIAGSHLLTWVDEYGRSNPNAWREQINKISPNNQALMLICRSGNRSMTAARFLDQQNPSRKIYNVREGMNGWQATARKTVSPK